MQKYYANELSTAVEFAYFNKPSYEEEADALIARGPDDEYDEGIDILAIMFMKGVEVKQDFVRAAKLWQLAIDMGILDIPCLELGRMYEDGKGVDQNYAKAAELYRRGADEGNFDECCYALGILHAKGLGVEQSDDLARDWLLRWHFSFA